MIQAFNKEGKHCGDTMEVKEAVQKRRAYRSLENYEITEEIVKDLAECARLAPSCFNNQPWRFVFVYDEEGLQRLYQTLSGGNHWAHSAFMIIFVFSKGDLDCFIKEREYYV